MTWTADQRAVCAYLVARGLLPAEALPADSAAEPQEASAERALVTALAHSPAAPYSWRGIDDDHDWHRNFGLHLLGRNDPTFADADYLLQCLRLGQPDDPGWRPAGHGSEPPAYTLWLEAWRRLAPNTRVLGFAQTGSDAVNMAFDVARRCGRARLRGWGLWAPGVTPGMAFFHGCYGGGRGESAGMNTVFSSTSAPYLQAWMLPDPSFAVLPQGDGLAQLLRVEQAALSKLEAMAQDRLRPLGAVYLEVIQAARGAYFFRHEFLAALRALADRHSLPIIDDEILTVGRTGRFFAYEEYAPEFVPDFITFGKGLEVAGLVAVDRGPHTLPITAFSRSHIGFVTARYPPSQQLLKSRQVLRALVDRDLLAHSARLGEVLVQGLRAMEARLGFDPPRTSGRGALIGTAYSLAVAGLDKVVAQNLTVQRPRLTPAITLPLDKARAILAEIEARLFSAPKAAMSAPAPTGPRSLESLSGEDGS